MSQDTRPRDTSWSWVSGHGRRKLAGQTTVPKRQGTVVLRPPFPPLPFPLPPTTYHRLIHDSVLRIWSCKWSGNMLVRSHDRPNMWERKCLLREHDWPDKRESNRPVMTLTAPQTLTCLCFSRRLVFSLKRQVIVVVDHGRYTGMENQANHVLLVNFAWFSKHAGNLP